MARLTCCKPGAETIVLAAFWATMLAVNWRYFVCFYLPSFYLGWLLSYAEGYLEHFGQPGNPFANSVSSYHRLYNFLWFNNGYHQEHHWDPKMHWTRMQELRADQAADGSQRHAHASRAPLDRLHRGLVEGTETTAGPNYAATTARGVTLPLAALAFTTGIGLLPFRCLDAHPGHILKHRTGNRLEGGHQGLQFQGARLVAAP